MKILYITTHLNRGGITSYLFALARGLKKRGHSIVVASSGGDSQKEFLDRGIEHIKIPILTKKEISPSVIFSYFILSRFLLRNRVDIIHAHTRVTQVLASFLSRRIKIPFVTTCHGFFKPRWHRKKFPCWGDKTIAISSQVKEHLLREFKVPDENIYLVHNGIDMSKIRDCSAQDSEKLKSEIGINKGNFVVGTAARFSSVKGLEYLIKSLPEVLRSDSAVVLLLLGQGREELNLRKVARELDIEDKVIFHEPVKETAAYLSVVDVFVMPSLQEGLGISILEAQAHKVPVVASNVGGIPDIIQDRVTGLLVESKSESAIARAILELKEDSGLRSKIKQNAYENIVNNFSLEQMVAKTEKVYMGSGHGL